MRVVPRPPTAAWSLPELEESPSPAGCRSSRCPFYRAAGHQHLPPLPQRDRYWQERSFAPDDPCRLYRWHSVVRPSSSGSDTPAAQQAPEWESLPWRLYRRLSTISQQSERLASAPRAQWSVQSRLVFFVG